MAGGIPAENEMDASLIVCDDFINLEICWLGLGLSELLIEIGCVHVYICMFQKEMRR